MEKHKSYRTLTRVFVFLCCSYFSCSYATQAIELCAVPLQEIVASIIKPFVAGMWHVFVRGADKTGLNFEPKNPLLLFGGKARIGRQNYPNATCEPIFTTEDPEEYKIKWQEIVEAYDTAARIYKYNLSHKNCQHVTREIIKALGYVTPKSS